MMTQTGGNLREALLLASRLIEFADSKSEECRDDGCLVVYGIMRDCGYKIKANAELALREGYLSAEAPVVARPEERR